MIINPEISISDFNKHQKLITVGERYIVVNNTMGILIQSLSNSKTLEEAYQKFISQSNFSFSITDFERIITEKILQHELLVSTNNNTEHLSRSYLRLRFQVLKKSQAELLAKWITPLFSTKIFWPFFVITFISNLIYLIHSDLSGLKIESAFLSIILLGLSTGVHELGHIAACIHKRISTGGIGIGFYFLIPVAYSDISNIWALSKHDRIVVNLGGIYCEYIYVLLLLIISILSGINSLQIAASIIMIKSFFQLNPFIRQDGYWLLSDIISQPNLIKKSRHAVKIFFKEVIQINSHQNGNFYSVSYSPYVLIYGILNSLITIVLLIYMISTYSDALVNFPANTFEICRAFANNTFPTELLSFGYLMTIIFFLLVIIRFKSIIKFIFSKFKSFYLSYAGEGKIK